MQNTNGAGDEIALWRAVIKQAIMDATWTPSDKPRKRKRRFGASSEKAARSILQTSIRYRDEARTWLLGDSKDFRSVCDMALLEPDAVRNKAEKLASAGWASESILEGAT